MKRLVPLFIVLAVALLVSIPNPTNGQSAGLVSSVLNRMERNRQSLKSLKAGLSMEKYNAQLRDKDQYVGLVTKAARELIDQGFLLAEDLAAVQRSAARHWDYAASTASPSTPQR